MRSLKEAGDEKRDSDGELIKRLKELTAKQVLTDEEMVEAKRIVKSLNNSYGDFGVTVDDVTNKITATAGAYDVLADRMLKLKQIQLKQELIESSSNLQKLAEQAAKSAAILDSAWAKLNPLILADEMIKSAGIDAAFQAEKKLNEDLLKQYEVMSGFRTEDSGNGSENAAAEAEPAVEESRADATTRIKNEVAERKKHVDEMVGVMRDMKEQLGLITGDITDFDLQLRKWESMGFEPEVLTQLTLLHEKIEKATELKKAEKDLEAFGKQIEEQVKSPIEKAADEFDKLEAAFAAGKMSRDTFKKGVKGIQDKMQMTADVSGSVGFAGYGKQIQDAIMRGAERQEEMGYLQQQIALEERMAASLDILAGQEEFIGRMAPSMAGPVGDIAGAGASIVSAIAPGIAGALGSLFGVKQDKGNELLGAIREAIVDLKNGIPGVFT